MQENQNLPMMQLQLASKEQRQEVVENILAAIDSGAIDPLSLHLQVKSIEDVFSRLTDKKKFPATASTYLDAVLTEAQKHGKLFMKADAEIQVKEAGMKFDYSKCGDPVLVQLEADAKELAEKIKDRQTLLQSAPASGLTLVDEETGEALNVFPPVKTSSTTVSITLNKAKK